VGERLEEAFEPVRNEPGARDARDRAARIFDRIAAAARPGPVHASLMAADHLVWAGLGFSEQARWLLRRWRKAGFTSEELRRAEIVYHVTAEPGAAAVHLRELGVGDPHLAALEVVNGLYRGELDAAIAVSRANGWFLGDPELAHGLFHGVWALGLSEAFEEAEAVIAAFAQRHPRADPNARQFLLRTEAGTASFQNRFSEEVALVEEALALCAEHDLGLAHTYTEPSAVGARARAGDFRGAHALVRTWPRRRREAKGPIEAFRDVAQLELAILEGRDDAAHRAGHRALRFWEDTQHAVMTSFVRLRLALCADASGFADAMAEFRRIVRACPIDYYRKRLMVLDQVMALGYACARDVHLAERSRSGVAELPLARVWTPPVTATGADLFWNRLVGTLYLRGRGPFRLGERPVLRRTLEALLEQPRLSIPVGALFAAVWGGVYDPLRHEGKIHVTIHRLRKWLDECVPGSQQLIAMGDGEVAIVPNADVRVLEPTRQDRDAGLVGETQQSVRERVLAAIRESEEPVAPRVLVGRLGISRSALNGALRVLTAEGHIERTGSGRAVCYVMARP